MEENIVEELEWETGNGKILKVIRKNPYGFYFFFFDKGGELPKALSGAYNNLRDVRAAGDKYIDLQPPSSTRPVLKTKPVSQKRKDELDNASERESQSL